MSAFRLIPQTDISIPVSSGSASMFDRRCSVHKESSSFVGQKNYTISSFIYFSPPSSLCPHLCGTCQHPVGLQQMWHHYSSSPIYNPPIHTHSPSLSPQHHRLPRIPSFSLPLHTQPFWFSEQHMRDSEVKRGQNKQTGRCPVKDVLSAPGETSKPFII